MNPSTTSISAMAGVRFIAQRNNDGVAAVIMGEVRRAIGRRAEQ